MTPDPIVDIRGLRKAFRLQRPWSDVLRRPGARDVRVALGGIDLQVGRGECFGVLGENGAGKSTLFKVLATLIRPDAGSARVGGNDVVDDAAAVRRILIPVVAGERSLYWRVSAEENLRLYAALYHIDRAVTATRIREVLDIVGLESAGAKQVGLFSSGMRQRLLIARALLGRPEVLLLDEPTRSLDPVSAREFRNFLRRQLLEDRGTTILLATHDHEEVTELCTRVAVLERGRLLAVGSTETLLSSARDRIYSIWTATPDHPAIRAAAAAAAGAVMASDGTPLVAGDRWHRLRVALPTDEEGAARFLVTLVEAGVPVSRFTRDDLSLADLLERVRRNGADGELSA